jgi:protein-histidine pros-kinase
MKLLKFNLIFLPLLALCLGAVAFAARGLLQTNAREQIVQNARIMMETATSSRTYTTKQVAPLLQHKNFKLQSAIAEFQKTLNDLPKDVDASIPKDVHYASAKKAYLLGQQKLLDAQKQLVDSVRNRPEELLDTEFHPQSVPAFAATEIFGYLRGKYPEYFYKEATLNPTNPRDRSADWETDIINQFRSNPALPEFMGTRETPTGTALFLARPIKITNVSCLGCHTTPDKAPPEMVKLYGTANGFGWKMDETIGAQVVSVPMSIPVGMADRAWHSLTLWLGGAFAGIALVGNACAAFR